MSQQTGAKRIMRVYHSALHTVSVESHGVILIALVSTEIAPYGDKSKGEVKMKYDHVKSTIWE